MAGLGMRFKNAGYTEEKYKIIFHGKTLFDWSLESLVNFKDHEFIFISRNFPEIQKFITERTKKAGIEKVSIEIISHPTRGQAETVLSASKYFTNDDSILIFNTDTYVNPAAIKPTDILGNGWIPVFSAQGDKWSFVETDNFGTVIKTTEKIRISDKCSIGMYYFDSYKQFEQLVLNLNRKGLGEWYIAPLYNDFIRKGNKVFAYIIPSESIMVLGTPEDILLAEKRFKY